MKNYHINQKGYYGEFGGCFVPESLVEPIQKLSEVYLKILISDTFQKKYRKLLRDYVGRPTPLYPASRLSNKYHCNIYLKREDLNHTGAHKINNVIGQILMAKMMGKKRIIAETGAGQHGVAVATACALMDIECSIYMGQADIERQNSNVIKIQMLGGKINSVTTGSMTLSNAINKALADWCSHADDTYYLLGSAVGPHPYPDIVARLQSVISEEIQDQLQNSVDHIQPDYLIACIGGGSNAAGSIYHFIDDEKVNIILAEAGGKGLNTHQTAATLSIGKPCILHGARTLALRDDNDNISEAYSISAGLDYPGVGPMFANLLEQKRISVVAINDNEALEAAFELTRLEGIIPAIESAHAIAALKKCTFKPDDIVVITVSGRGDKDLQTYLKYFKN